MALLWATTLGPTFGLTLGPTFDPRGQWHRGPMVAPRCEIRRTGAGVHSCGCRTPGVHHLLTLCGRSGCDNETSATRTSPVQAKGRVEQSANTNRDEDATAAGGETCPTLWSGGLYRAYVADPAAVTAHSPCRTSASVVQGVMRSAWLRVGPLAARPPPLLDPLLRPWGMSSTVDASSGGGSVGDSRPRSAPDGKGM
jgi:hypothetical protein